MPKQSTVLSINPDTRLKQVIIIYLCFHSKNKVDILVPLHGNLARITVVSIRTNTTKIRNAGIVSPAARLNHSRFQKQQSLRVIDFRRTGWPHIPQETATRTVFRATKINRQQIYFHASTRPVHQTTMMSLCKPSSNSVSRQGPIKLLKSWLNKQRNWLYGWLNWFYFTWHQTKTLMKTLVILKGERMNAKTIPKAE